MVNLLECLEHWAGVQPDATLFDFLDGKGNSREHYTFRRFYERTLGLSKHLMQLEKITYGDRVLLVYPPGLEMMVGFFACLESGAIPVPVCAPMTTASRAAIDRIEHIAHDCEANLALTTSSYLRGISDAPESPDRRIRSSLFPESASWFATDTITESATQNGNRKLNPILFLQYTSGSTGDPKGVTPRFRTRRSAYPGCRSTTTWDSSGISCIWWCWAGPITALRRSTF
jgi:acyl-CoA synthetase (AMP-forming)/AMP-acid ligase II